MKCVLYLFDRFFRMAAPAEPNTIGPVTFSVIAITKRIGKRILDDNGISADKRLAPDTGKLMNAAKGADRYVVGCDDVAGECDAVGKDITIPDQAIVRDMNLGHEQIIVTNLRQAAAAGGAAMYSYSLADLVALADLGSRRFAFVLQVLRRQADRRERENMRVTPNPCVAVDHYMRFKPHAAFQNGVAPDSREWADIAALTDRSSVGDDRGRVYE